MGFREGKVARETHSRSLRSGAIARAMGRADVLTLARHDGQPPIARSELSIDIAALARYLPGKVVVRDLPEGVISRRIVETEAYVVGNAAGHAYRGITQLNPSLLLERGHAYAWAEQSVTPRQSDIACRKAFLWKNPQTFLKQIHEPFPLRSIVECSIDQPGLNSQTSG